MQIKNIITASAFCLMLFSCSSNSAESAENTSSEALIEEITSLDSLNQELEQSTEAIETSIKDVEAALSEIDD